jgi:DNA replication protein DnaC
MAQDLLIQHHLKRLRLPAIGRQHKKLAQEAAQENRPYEEYLLRLLEMEVAQREERAQQRRIAQARFPYVRTLDQFASAAAPSVNQAKLLELAQGEYLAKQENIVLVCTILNQRNVVGAYRDAPQAWSTQRVPDAGYAHR